MALPDCPDDNTLGAFVDVRLDEAERAALVLHLDTCVPCREAVSAITAVRSGVTGAREGATVEDDAELASDTRIGRFIVMGMIGRGGMGVVYRAHDPALDRDVALKLLRTDREQGVAAEAASARLEREAKAIARVRHPNVIAVHDVGTFEERVFLTMELVEGETLASFLTRAKRAPAEIVAAFAEAGLGLAAAHDADLVHRDFKPDNVLVGSDGRIRVTDFGLACAADVADPEAVPGHPPAFTPGTLTRTGALLGTPAYMAPEQHRGEAVSAQSDQFSFCVALWEALAGELPFRTLEDRLAGKVAPLGPKARMPSRVRRALLQGLRPSPAERHPSMRALLRVLVPPRSRFVVPVLFAVAAAAIAAFVSLKLARPAAVCASATGGLANVWDPAKKQVVGDALRATGKPYAASAVAEVDRVLDAYASGWTAMRQDACEATFVRREQSEDLLDRRMRCLDERRAELAALVTLLAQGGDTIERAAGAAHGLSSLGGCADAAALRARVDPPKDAGARAEVSAIEAELGAAQAERDLGRTPAARTRIDAAVARARKAGHGPTLARALWLAGLVHSAGQDPLGAESSLREAATVADAAGDDETRARAWMELTRLIGYRTERTGAGFEAAEEARAAIARLGGSDELEAKRLDGLAIVLYTAGRQDESVAAFRRSIELRERVFGPDAREVAESVNHLGGVLSGTGAAADTEALALLRRSLAINEKIYGPEHPQSVANRVSIARALVMTQHFDEAANELRHELPLLEAAQGPAHPTMGYALSLLGTSLDGLRKHAEALPNHRRALAILEKTLGPKHREVAKVTVDIGSCLIKLGRIEEADEVISRGLSLSEEILPKDNPLLVDPLYAMGELRSAQHRPIEAIAPLERAIVLAKGQGPGVRGQIRLQLARALVGAKKKAEAKAVADAASADLDAAGESGAATRKELTAFVEREGLR